MIQYLATAYLDLQRPARGREYRQVRSTEGANTRCGSWERPVPMGMHPVHPRLSLVFERRGFEGNFPSISSGPSQPPKRPSHRIPVPRTLPSEERNGTPRFSRVDSDGALFAHAPVDGPSCHPRARNIAPQCKVPFIPSITEETTYET